MLSLLPCPPKNWKTSQLRMRNIFDRSHESLVVMSVLAGMNINDVVFNCEPTARCGSLKEPSWLKDGTRVYLKSAGKMFTTHVLFSNTCDLKCDNI